MDPAAEPRVFALRRRASVYGHNAPVWGTMPLDFQLRYEAVFDSDDLQIAADLGSFEVATATALASESASPAPPAPPPPSESLRALSPKNTQWPKFTISPVGDSVDLDSVYSEMPSGSLVVLAAGDFNYVSEPGPANAYVELYTVGNVAELSRQEFTVGTKVTRLQLIGANRSKFTLRVRDTTVFGQSEELRFAAYPVTDPVSGHSIPVVAPLEGLEPGRRLLVRGQRERGEALIHAATLLSATAAGAGRGLLAIDPPLPFALKRDTVYVHANVALASHGETSTQILGAGNAAAAFQRFELRQLPLTHRAAPGEFGVAPSITVRVDDIAWQPRDTLFGAGPKDRAYVLTNDEQGRHFVQFGDGTRGARPSTGINNLRAIYRKGLGTAGNVGAESLTQLAQRPLGLKGVSNPLPAEGGTDPEAAGTARQAMPLLTRTLGRAVSVLDYEDFARGFAGVAKARAAVLQLPSGPAIAITIAGPDGSVIQPTSPIYRNLADALVAGGDPYVTVRLLPHRPATFRVGLKVRCDAAFEPRQVMAAVEAGLREQFGFAARALGAPLRQSEVIAAAQSVRGVVAVDLDFLYGGTAPASQTTRSCQQRLLAGRMSVSAGIPQPDELLTLHPGALERLEEMS
jgi:predicted phage baseplate assembly protein